MSLVTPVCKSSIITVAPGSACFSVSVILPLMLPISGFSFTSAEHVIAAVIAIAIAEANSFFDSINTSNSFTGRKGIGDVLRNYYNDFTSLRSLV